MVMSSNSATDTAKVVISTTKYEAVAELLLLIADKVTPGAPALNVGNSADVEDVLVKCLRQVKAYNHAKREEAIKGIRVKCEAVIDTARQTRVRAVAAWRGSPDMQEAMPGFDEQTHIRLLAKSFAFCMSDTLTFQQVIVNLQNMGYDVSVPDGRKKGPQDPYIIVPITPKA